MRSSSTIPADGLVVDSAFWDKERCDMDIDRGPWTPAVDYIKALALGEIAWIQRYAKPRTPDDPLYVSNSQNIPSGHISLLQKYLFVAPYLLPQEEDILGPILWHPDLCTPNIFVNDRGNITSIINWHSTWAGPLFLEGRHPHFLQYYGEIMLRLPKDFRQLDTSTQAGLREQATKSILVYLYERYMTNINPTLHRVFVYPNGLTLSDPVRFAGSTWEDILPLQESLMRVVTKWDSINDTVKCPIHFPPEDRCKHYEEGEGWNEIQDFWDTMTGILEKDSWTSHETYDRAREIFAKLQAPAPTDS
ncbi:hypothetical protein BDV25DRAFT_143648 [Aspergillus avenaceus]|uniref:Aminoglycoside phosphotransferase domain-containing protein n=1 Tax=Aspergillus avenaceus TaxID=36643 RepID=A0A5N6TJD1_ASPAV|nr:hypothetical protein BDV25DRAFT_143648 [Aspergillus avenaceus]